MEFISTRGKDGPISFETALLNGLARDGGLYLPFRWPRFLDEIRQMRDLSYSDLAGLLMSRFTDGEIDQVEMTSLARQSYADFTHPDVAPLRPVTRISIYWNYSMARPLPLKIMRCSFYRASLIAL